MHRMYREIQNLGQNFSLKSWLNSSQSESSRMTPGPDIIRAPDKAVFFFYKCYFHISPQKHMLWYPQCIFHVEIIKIMYST